MQPANQTVENGTAQDVRRWPGQQGAASPVPRILRQPLRLANRKATGGVSPIVQKGPQLPAPTLAEPGLSDRWISSNNEHIPEPGPYVPPSAFRQPMKLLNTQLNFVGGDIEKHLHARPLGLVVGTVGCQGVGKSFVLSQLGSTDCHKGVFAVQSEDCIMRGECMTEGVDMFVTSAGTVLLDTQAVLSAAQLDQWLHDNARNVDGISAEINFSVQSMQLVLFLFAVCHVVLVAMDHIDTTTTLALVRSCALLDIPLAVATAETAVSPISLVGKPHVVFVYNQSPRVALCKSVIRETQSLIAALFEGTDLPHRGVCSMTTTRLWKKKDDGAKQETEKCVRAINSPENLNSFGRSTDDVSVFFLPCLYTGPAAKNKEEVLLLDSPQSLISMFVNQIKRAPRRDLDGPMTEKDWLQFASRMAEAVSQSQSLAKYHQTLQTVWHTRSRT